MFSDTSKTKSPDYLFRNPHSYCFRMIVPEALRPSVGRRELRYSLRTGRLSQARFKARLMAGLCQQLFAQIRGNPAAHGRSMVEANLQEFLGLVLQDSGNLPRSNPGPEVFTAGTGTIYRSSSMNSLLRTFGLIVGPKEQEKTIEGHLILEV